MSQIILVVKGDTVFGAISKPNFTYRIRHVADGLHFVYETDPFKFPPAGARVSPNLKMNSPKLPDEDKRTERENKTISLLLAKSKHLAQGSSSVGFGWNGINPSKSIKYRCGL